MTYRPSPYVGRQRHFTLPLSDGQAKSTVVSARVENGAIVVDLPPTVRVTLKGNLPNNRGQHPPGYDTKREAEDARRPETRRARAAAEKDKKPKPLATRFSLATDCRKPFVPTYRFHFMCPRCRRDA